MIDSGTLRHMTGHHMQLKMLSKRKSSYSVEFGDDKSYLVRGIRSTLIELENRGNIHLNNIVFVLALHKNLLSFSSLEDKGDRVAFIDGIVVVWDKNESIEEDTMIGIHEGKLYRLINPLG